MDCVLLPTFSADATDAPTHLTLDGPEAHHLATVRRRQPGQPVRVLNGLGSIADCTITAVHKREVQLDVTAVRQAPPLTPRVVLVQALSKIASFETILQQSTELGVSDILPVHTANCEARVKPQRAAAKLDRWQRILESALKQCGNPWLPRLHPLADFATCWSHFDADRILLADLAPGAQPIHHLLQPADQTTAILIGPEGDFTSAERRIAAEHGALSLSLGPRVLRVETAAATALALIHHEHTRSGNPPHP